MECANKPLVIYHGPNCADGFGAAFAAWLKFGDEAEYLPMQYCDKLNSSVTQLHNRDIYILDFSFDKQRMDALINNCNSVVWLDHHKTAFEMWCGSIPDNGLFEYEEHYCEYGNVVRICLDNNKSGAYLAWEYFHPGTEVPMLIQHIDDYDRWQFKIEGTKAFSKALWSYAPWSFDQWRDQFYDKYSGDPHYCDSGREQLITEGEAILRAHDQNVQSVVKGLARECHIYTSDFTREPGPDFSGLAANCPPHLSSDAGHELATQSGTFGLLWHLDKYGKCKCSLRSNGDYDVSAIAKAFGGGGHLNAAGFEVPIETLLGWLK